MSRLTTLAMLAAATAALSACSTAGSVADRLNPFNDGANAQNRGTTVPQDGRMSFLTFEQQLTPDPALQGRISTPAPVDTPNWPQPGGTPTNAPSNIAGTTQLEVVWRQSLGAGSGDDVHIAAPPVISDGRLYFLDGEHNVVAINAETGQRVWEHRLRPEEGRDRHALGGGLAIDGGRVFVTSGFGFVVALDAATGAEAWRRRTDAPFHAAPTVAGGRLYAVTNDSELMAIDTSTGEVSWNYQAIAEPARILAASSPAVDGETVIAPFASGELVALIAGNGRRLWVDALSRSGRMSSLTAINDIAGRPVVSGGTVYAVSHSGVIAAIDMRSGQRRWARNFASTQTPWLAGDVLYAVSVDGELVAFNRTDGHIFWVRQLRRFENEDNNSGRVSWSGPIMVGSRLILANSLGQVVSVAPDTGETGATRDVGSPVFIPPIAAGGRIYITTDDARLVVLR